MTKEKLAELVQLSNKIDNIKRDIDELNYIKNDDYIFLSAKDGRVTYEKYAYSRIPRSLTHLICEEVEHKLKMELASLESKFEQEDVQSNMCEWIEYDYRTMCPTEHGDVDNPYWRIPYDKVHLTYCPYCGKKIFMKQ